MTDEPRLTDKPSEVVSENVNRQQNEETIEDMLARHRKETNDLQSKETSMKKAAAKGSKAEQKAKKKQVEEEITRLSAKLKEKQAKELSSLGYDSSDNNKNSVENLAKAIAGVSVNTKSEQSKPSKRREKRAQEEAAREQRIQEEQSQVVSDRMIEDEKLEKKLEPFGFAINEIKPDGHCLYRAVEDQLAFHDGGSSPYTYVELRKMVADYMRRNSADFFPFFTSESDVSEDSVEERFENYCKEIESTASWGGQLELGALTHCLKRHIVVFSGSFPDVEMGKEYKSGQSSESIRLSYHKHAFGLGEHYNSVVPS